MKRVTFVTFIEVIFLLILFLPRPVCGDTHTVGPNDCSAAAVNVAISAASDGDIVELTCTGTVNWTSIVTIPNTKGITLKVPGASNNWRTGSNNFPLTICSNNDPIIYVNCENSKSVARVTGFKFRNTISSTKGAVYIRGRGTGIAGKGAFRIDNNYFDTIRLPHANEEGTITVEARTGPLYGLIDNNTLYDCSYTDGYAIALSESWRPDTGRCWGENSWIRSFSFGTADFVFIEDNLIQNQNEYTRHYIEASSGARYVVRYNRFITNKAKNNGNQTEQVEAHGYCIAYSTGVGSRGGEIYNNESQGTQVGVPINIRGGHWLIYDNTFTNKGWRDTPICLREYRTWSGSCDQCSSDNGSCPDPWYKCVTDGSKYPLQEQIQNTYVWGNTINAIPTTASVPNHGVQRLYLQDRRDYWNVSSLADAKAHGLSASYTPFTYPHPLRASDSGPAASKDLRITP